MEILVTIVAFWLILVGLYGAYTVLQDRQQARARSRTPRQISFVTGSGPFAPVSLPAETVPSFITRAGGPIRVAPMPKASTSAAASATSTINKDAGSSVEESGAPDRFRAERVIAARLAEAKSRREAGSYLEARYEAPARDEAEVGQLRAKVDHLRTEVYALSADRSARTERPEQRRYRTGNYTHLPPTLRRQVNEARGFHRFND